MAAASISEIRSTFTAGKHQFGHFVYATTRDINQKKKDIHQFVEILCSPIDVKKTAWKVVAKVKDLRDTISLKLKSRTKYSGHALVIEFKIVESELKKFNVKPFFLDSNVDIQEFF